MKAVLGLRCFPVHLPMSNLLDRHKRGGMEAAECAFACGAHLTTLACYPCMSVVCLGVSGRASLVSGAQFKYMCVSCGVRTHALADWRLEPTACGRLRADDVDDIATAACGSLRAEDVDRGGSSESEAWLKSSTGTPVSYPSHRGGDDTLQYPVSNAARKKPGELGAWDHGGTPPLRASLWASSAWPPSTAASRNDISEVSGQKVPRTSAKGAASTAASAAATTSGSSQ